MWSLILEVGFTLRCLQRLSHPHFASLLCRWHDNSCTSGASIPVPVCFSHIYSRELSPNRVRDYDNLELKQLLDVIATFVMEDDTGLLCDAYNMTEIGDSDCTRVSVMDKERFQGWLSDRENRLRSISDL